MHNYKLLNKALQEEESRRHTSIDEINKLISTTSNWYNNINNNTIEYIKNITLSALDNDITMISKLNNYLTNSIDLEKTFALKTNKNFELFTCAKKLIDDDFINIVNNDIWSKYNLTLSDKTTFGKEGDVKGTSFLNCLQTGVFSILYSNHVVKNIADIQDLAQSNIYNVNHSPNVHTTKLPENIQHNEVDPNFINWAYFYKDEYSPTQGELMFFTLGYSFGGSRLDERYNNKEFKTEDCSSAVAKWIESIYPFSTLHMEEAFDNDCHNAECEVVTSIMAPVITAEKGDIYVFRKYDINLNPEKSDRTYSKSGHTGIVTNVYPERNCFESLSYNRDMPKIEGLGFHEECMDNYPEKKYMFFTLKNNNHDIIDDYYDIQDYLADNLITHHDEL